MASQADHFDSITQKVIKTARLVLEPIEEKHAQEMWSLLSDQGLHRFTPFEPLSLEEQRKRCLKWARRKSPDGTEIWLNWVGREVRSGKAMAHFQAGISSEKVATLGYLVAREFQNRGLAFEGLESVLEYLRIHFFVREAKAFIDTRNIASHRLAQKLGMTSAGVLKDADFFKGTTSDEFVFSKVLIP